MQKKYYLSACCILKDEDPFIMEWLTYHSLIGVEHFFIYDNESQNPLAENPLIQKFHNQGKVTVLNTPGKVMQYPAYRHCHINFGPLTKWLAFIDLDEFICPLEENDLRPLLAAYEDYAALGLSWKCFSSGGHLSRPKGLVIKNYQERFLQKNSRDLLIKSIMQPDKNREIHTPHSFWPNEGEMAVNSSGFPIAAGMAMTLPCWERACVNHYILKSQEDAQRRIIRGRADIKSDRPTIDNNDFYAMVKEPVEPDDSIVKFAPEVENWLGYEELPEEYSAALAGRDAEDLFSTAERLIKDEMFKEAGITLCHAALTQSENPRLWQTRARLAAMQQQDWKVTIFAEKIARIKAGLSSSKFPRFTNLKKFSEQRAAEQIAQLKDLFYDKKYAEAEQILKKLAEKYCLYPEMWLIRGAVATARKDYALAEESLLMSLSLEENLLTYRALLTLRLKQKRLTEAMWLAFYLVNTHTYRVNIETENGLVEDKSFYKPLEALFTQLKAAVGI